MSDNEESDKQSFELSASSHVDGKETCPNCGAQTDQREGDHSIGELACPECGEPLHSRN